MTDDVRIAEMLCTRLCHDLTGPIGAVNNGAEFLSEEGFNMQHQAMELITSSAFSAVARLQFYRVAYGRVKEHGEASLADHQKLANDFFTGSKITLHWPDHYGDAAGVSLSVRMVRMLFNLLIIASATLLKGGTIAVKLEMNEETGKVVEVTAEGESMKWDKETEALLAAPGDITGLTPKNVQVYLTRMLAEALGADFVFAITPQSVTIRAVQRRREAEEAA